MNIKLMMALILIVQQGLYASTPSNGASTPNAGKAVVASATADGSQKKQTAEGEAKTNGAQTTATSAQPPAPVRRFSGSSYEPPRDIPTLPAGILRNVFASHVQVFEKYDWSHNTKTSPVKGTEVPE